MYREFSNDSEAPVSRFEQMLKTNQVYFFDASEFEYIIQYYIDSGEVNLAKKALHLATKQHPFHTEILLLKSELLIFDGKFQEAQNVLDAIEEIEPSHQEIYIQKATIHSKKREHKKSIALLQKSLELTDDPVEIWCLLAMEYLVMEDFEQAKYYFKCCIEEDPFDYQVLYNLLYCYEFLKLHDEALETLNKVIESNPYNEIAWLEIGKQYLTLGKEKEALSAFDFAIISEDHFTGAYFEKGKLLEKLGRYNEAIENYEITLRLEDPTSFAYLRIAKCHEMLGNDMLVIQYLNKTVHEDPSNEKGWLAFIDYYWANGQLEKALYYAQKALQINEHNLNYWKRNARIHKALEKYAEAEIAYQNTIELGNYELSIWQEWLDTLIFLNEWEKVCQIGFQAKEFYPEELSIDFKIGGAYGRMGKRTEMEYFKKSLCEAKEELPMDLLSYFPELKGVLD